MDSIDNDTDSDIDLRRMHFLVNDSVSRMATRWMVAVLITGFSLSFFLAVPLMMPTLALAILVRVAGWCLPLLVRPLVARVDGLEIVGDERLSWTEVSSPSWSALGKLRRVYLGYRLAFAWMWTKQRRLPLLLVGEAAWILEIARMRELARARSVVGERTSYRR